MLLLSLINWQSGSDNHLLCIHCAVVGYHFHHHPQKLQVKEQSSVLQYEIWKKNPFVCTVPRDWALFIKKNKTFAKNPPAVNTNSQEHPLEWRGGIVSVRYVCIFVYINSRLWEETSLSLLPLTTFAQNILQINCIYCLDPLTCTT